MDELKLHKSTNATDNAQTGKAPDTGNAATQRVASGSSETSTAESQHADTSDVDHSDSGSHVGAIQGALGWLGDTAEKAVDGAHDVLLNGAHAVEHVAQDGLVTAAKAANVASGAAGNWFESLFGGGEHKDVTQGYAQDPNAKPGDVAKTLEANESKLDTAAGGKKDGIFGIQDLQKVAGDNSQPADLRKAAQDVLGDPNLYHALDIGSGGGLDDKISNKDLDAIIKGQSTSGDHPSILDEARSLNSSFDTFDSAKNGKKDGKISIDDLKAVAGNAKASQSDRDLANQLLKDPTYWDAFDEADHKGGKDGVVSKDDINEVISAPEFQSGDAWDSSKAASLDKALNDPNISTSDLFSGFSQTDRGNCVSTAIIKGATEKYGNKIFDSVQKNGDGGYTVKLQDGTDVSVTKDELSAAAGGQHYVVNNPETGAYANLAYAVMAKRAQELGHDSSRTYGEALTSLGDGENPDETPKFLGLENKVQKIDLKDVPGKTGVVAWGGGHCIYIDSEGGKTLSDHYGDPQAYNGTNTYPNEKLTDAYIFT